MNDKDKNSASEVIEKSAHTAQAIKGAVKAGKSVASTTKGAAVG